MPDQTPLLEVEDLSVRYRSDGPAIAAVQNVSFALARREMLGVVGESGSGKSTLLQAIMCLLPHSARVSSGSVRFEGDELLSFPEGEMARVRGSRIGMVLQDPVNAFNPSFTISNQLERVFRLHRPDVGRRHRKDEVLRLLSRVGIDGTEKLHSYPFEFSQGQLQRIAIAAACLVSRVALLLADEPTTSLDVTIEAQIMSVLAELRQELDLGILLVSHDIALVAQHCDRIMVMHAGRVVEEGATATVVDHPRHPYTAELVRSVPELDVDSERLYSTQGEGPGVPASSRGCSFARRCPRYMGSICDDEIPSLDTVGDGRVACHAAKVGADAEGVSR